jgi:hypothetical protein
VFGSSDLLSVVVAGCCGAGEGVAGGFARLEIDGAGAGAAGVLVVCLDGAGVDGSATIVAGLGAGLGYRNGQMCS